MRIIADENVPRDTVDALRSRGHDIVWVRTVMPGSDDRVILARAQDESRLVLTFDKNFGERAFRTNLPASSGIVLLRISMPSSMAVARLVVEVLEGRDDWTGHFAEVDDERIRKRPLPGLEI